MRADARERWHHLPYLTHIAILRVRPMSDPQNGGSGVSAPQIRDFSVHLG